MNKKALERAKGMISDARSLIEEIQQDEQERFDSRSEKWQESDKGLGAQVKLDALGDIVTMLEDIDESLEDLLGE